MKRTFVRILIVALVATMLSGCGSTAGPVTLGNVFQNYPPKPRGLAVNLEASLVVCDYQPRDADVWIEGWFTVPSDPNGVSRRRIEFTNNEIHGSDSMTGRANFVVSSYEWEYDPWGNFALRAGVQYYFMLTIRDPDGQRVSVTVWRYANGAVTQVS